MYIGGAIKMTFRSFSIVYIGAVVHFTHYRFKRAKKAPTPCYPDRSKSFNRKSHKVVF